jgi:hypothetical protein
MVNGPVEPVAGQALLVAQAALCVAQRRVRLAGRPADRRSIEPLCPAASLALDASNSARKLPAPKPWSALALDDLEEERPGSRVVLQARRSFRKICSRYWLARLAVDQDLQLAQRPEVLVDAPDADASAARAARRSSGRAWA